MERFNLDDVNDLKVIGRVGFETFKVSKRSAYRYSYVRESYRPIVPLSISIILCVVSKVPLA